MSVAERLDLEGPVAALDSLVCSLCGYGVARSGPPERCPMCQERDAWVQPQARPFGRGVHPEPWPGM